ncbi:MFS transporter [Pleomorphovibrio marinus]|uniref:MFS transporter n=1 Tax=Pleomorphovibrio marinus TaxID=2164132 RepID=UPI000E0C58F8|nr:MFS transporter [Pleomorphovibrio marinus]
MKQHRPKPLIPSRYFMVLGTFLLALLMYVDRIGISVAKGPMTESLGLSDKQFGWALSVFALGYALFQTPFGMLADRFGPRKILTAVVSLWSIFTALTGAVTQYFSLIIVRFLFGVGEAGAYPGIAKGVYLWIPIRERGVVNGINFSGGRFGAAFSLPLIAFILDLVGWRATFFILGLVGILWATAWYLLFRDKPEDHPYVSAYEKEEILKARGEVKEEKKAGSKVALHSMLHSKNMWLAMGQYFASNFTFFFCLTWLFPHLQEQYNLAAVEAGFYSSLPLIAGGFGNMVSGWMVDAIYRRGYFRWSRILPAILGFGLAAAGLIISLFAQDVVIAISFLSMAVFGADMTLSPSWTFCVDIGKAHSGAVSGTMNMAGNIGSFLTALAFPYLREWTGSVTPFFILGAVLNILAIFIWLKMKPDVPISFETKSTT